VKGPWGTLFWNDHEATSAHHDGGSDHGQLRVLSLRSFWHGGSITRSSGWGGVVDREFSSYNATTLTAIEFAEQCREEARWAMNKTQDAGSYTLR
jgi:hypothetical protein